MAATYRLTRAAADDVVTIYLQGLDMFGGVQADKYHGGLEAAFRFLADYPRAARLRTALTIPVRAYPYKSHLVVYRTDSDGILVVRVRHAPEDWMAEFD